MTVITHPTIDLACRLIQYPSITPNDHGCQADIAAQLQTLGFEVNVWTVEGTTNLLASIGSGETTLLFAGHTDVVPPGPVDQWSSPPFEPTLRYGALYGRGACDMKGAIAAFLEAIRRFLDQNILNGRLMIALTSDEEGPAKHGMVEIIKKLQNQKIHIDYCLIGEPTSTKTLGDGIKIGRRGSLNGFAQLFAQQGHVAYLSENPLHALGPLIQSMTSIQYAEPHPDFPPTQLQITHLHAGDGTTNIIPGEVQIQFNFRYAPTDSHLDLMKAMDACFTQTQLKYTITWDHSARPYHSPASTFADHVSEAIERITQTQTHPNTAGGTSDGRFLIDLGCEIVECGLSNASIHQINEHVQVEDLIKLTDIYECILSRTFMKK